MVCLGTEMTSDTMKKGREYEFMSPPLVFVFYFHRANYEETRVKRRKGWDSTEHHSSKLCELNKIRGVTTENYCPSENQPSSSTGLYPSVIRGPKTTLSYMYIPIWVQCANISKYKHVCTCMQHHRFSGLRVISSRGISNCGHQNFRSLPETDVKCDAPPSRQ